MIDDIKDYCLSSSKKETGKITRHQPRLIQFNRYVRQIHLEALRTTGLCNSLFNSFLSLVGLVLGLGFALDNPVENSFDVIRELAVKQYFCLSEYNSEHIHSFTHPLFTISRLTHA